MDAESDLLSLWYLGVCLFVLVGGSVKRRFVHSASPRREIARVVLGLRGEFILQFNGRMTVMDIITIT